MTALLRRKTWLLLLFLSVILFACNDSDTKKISKTMEERLMDALAFEDSTGVEGTPPAAIADSSTAPQITAVDAPDTLLFDQQFDVWITTDFALPQEVVGAVVHIEKVKYYLKVTGQLDEANQMRLAGTLNEDAELSGDFTIWLSLMKNDGSVGNYWPWQLNVPKQDVTTDGDTEQDGEEPITAIFETRGTTEKEEFLETRPQSGAESKQTPVLIGSSIWVRPETAAKKDYSENIPLGSGMRIYFDYTLEEGEVYYAIIQQEGVSEFIKLWGLGTDGSSKYADLFVPAGYTNYIGQHLLNVALAPQKDGTYDGDHVSNYIQATLTVVDAAQADGD